VADKGVADGERQYEGGGAHQSRRRHVCEVHQHYMSGDREHRNNDDDFKSKMVTKEKAGQTLKKFQSKQEEQDTSEHMLDVLLQFDGRFYRGKAARLEAIKKQRI
jgi:hypothetical protein